MKELLFALALLASSSLLAADKNYECWLDDEFDDWAVEVTLDEKQENSRVRFFDNDTWDTLQLKRVRILESHPPQIQYTFVSYVGRSLRVRNQFVFNQTRLKGYISGGPGTPADPMSCAAR